MSADGPAGAAVVHQLRGAPAALAALGDTNGDTSKASSEQPLVSCRTGVDSQQSGPPLPTIIPCKVPLGAAIGRRDTHKVATDG